MNDTDNDTAQDIIPDEADFVTEAHDQAIEDAKLDKEPIVEEKTIDTILPPEEEIDILKKPITVEQLEEELGGDVPVDEISHNNFNEADEEQEKEDNGINS